MEYKRLLQLMKDPGQTGPETVPSLQELIKEFPYFQTAHLLLARSMQEQQHIRFERQLKVAAAYAADRRVLFSLIHDQQKFTEPIPIVHEGEILSPFVLEEEQVETLVSSRQTEESPLNENPFIESDIPVASSPVQEEPDQAESTELSREDSTIEYRYARDSDEQVPAEIPAPVILSSSTSEVISSDPREILRRRLSEILGNPVVPEETVPVSDDQKKSVDITNQSSTEITEPVDTALKSVIPDVQQTSAKEEVEEKKSEEAPVEINIPNIIIHESIEDKVEESKKQSEEILPDDLSYPIDSVEKMELEHALEASVLSSLENLPLIDKSSDSEKTASTSGHQQISEKGLQSARTFESWLKTLGGGDYGKVEEVHSEESRENHSDGFSGQTINRDLSQNEQKEPSESGVKSADLKIPDRKQSPEALAKETGLSAQKRELIEKFIVSEPKIVPSKAEFYSPITQAKRSIEENDDVVSETLARIYRQQGHPLKARFCYEKLSLFYPEKRPYFAALIKEIDQELNSSNQEDL